MLESKDNKFVDKINIDRKIGKGEQMISSWQQQTNNSVQVILQNFETLL